LPILAQLDLRATVFVTTGFLDGSIAPPWRSRDPALLEEYHRERAAFLPLSWAQLEALCASGRVDIGCHSVSHPRLGTLSPDEVRDEAGHAREQLEVRLGRSVEHFAYPFGVARYGAYSDTTELVLQQLGFKSSCTSEIGRAACGGGTWLLRRMPLTDEDLPRDVLAKATGAYDWVGWAQQVYQRVFPNPH
jgi:peptidoglycan/xylan/chitin deacetylase (PgdA/CDA1 family)